MDSNIKMSLHIDGPDDEPVDIDADLTQICSECNHQFSERLRVYKESDWWPTMCPACGAEFRITIKTTVTFEATVDSHKPPIVESFRKE